MVYRFGSTENAYLYRGERFDADIGQNYLRARFYNQTAGRFWNQDTYEGSVRRPPSQHKYLYGNGDPVQCFDPSGYIAVSNFIYGTIVHEYIGADFERYGFGTYDVPIGTLVGNPASIFARYRPDLVTPATALSPGQVYEIKPILTGQVAAAAQLGFYLVALHAADLQNPKRMWIPGTEYNPPTVIPIKAGTVAFSRRTAPGVILYEVVDATEIAVYAAAYAVASIEMDLAFALTLSLRGIN